MEGADSDAEVEVDETAGHKLAEDVQKRTLGEGDVPEAQKKARV